MNLFKKTLIVVACSLCTTITINAATSQKIYPFQNKELPVSVRVADLIERMTIEEKIDLLSSYRNWFLHPCERLGVPAFQMIDGPLGIASWGEFGRATAFPASLAIAASWNPELAGRLGDVYAQEWRARGMHFLLAPGVNNYRASKSARNFEYMGEDPYLVSSMIVPFIRQVQEGGVIATVKHFVGNDQEFDRYRVSTEVSERALQEIYFPPFKAAVQQAHVKAVMTGYNLVNGIYCTENKTLMDVLKKEWGFRGILMSDWSCVFSENAAINGLDMEMGSNVWLVREKILPMLKEGRITEEVINEKVRRIYTACMEMGFFDRPQKKADIPTFNPQANRMAYEAAAEGVVLLKNEDNLLPLDKTRVRKVAVIGPNACSRILTDNRYNVGAISYGGGGSSCVHPWYVVSPLDGIMREFPDAEINYTEGISTEFKSNCFRNSIFHTEDGQEGLSADYYTRDGDTPLYSKKDQRVNFEWLSAPDGRMGEEFRVEWSGHVDVEKNDSITFFVDTQGGCKLWIDGKNVIDAYDSESFFAGHITVAAKKGDKLAVKLAYDNHRALPSEVRLGYIYQSDVDFSEAIRLAEKADVVIVCVGLDGIIEREGRDRPFELTYGQPELIRTVTKANKNTVVAISAGGGVEMASWIDCAKSVLHTFYAGQEGGNALAHILSGKVNPSAKLPFTIEKRWEDSPAFGNYDNTRSQRKIYYREGIFTGYRGYDKQGIAPLFAFGHGLSYTTFDYSNLRVLSINRKEHTVEIACTVTNSGLRDGREIVELYVHDGHSKEPRPLKELKAFKKISLKAKESKEIHFTLEADAFRYFSEKRHAWTIDTGIFEIWIGASSADIRLKTVVKL